MMKHYYRYLPLSDEIRASRFYVIAGGYTRIPPETPYPPQSHPTDHDFSWTEGRTLQEYQLIYITSGGGVFESRASGARRIEAGDLFMLFPGEWHRYSPDQTTGWDEHWIAFAGEQIPEIVDPQTFSLAEPALRVGIDSVLKDEFTRAIEEMRESAVGYQKILAARAQLILALVSAAAQRQSFAGTDILRVIEQAKVILQEQIDQPVNMEKLASDLGVGYSWFRRMFREYTELSPSQYHLQLRINRACELLSRTTLPVAAISERVGFESAYYFSHIFREKTGSSPREYRAKSQTKPGKNTHSAPLSK
jgi:AraC-like DNA-binding protein